MNVSQTRSAFEAMLHNCHRQAYYAAEQADKLGYDGAIQDLHRIQALLHRMVEDSLSSNPNALARLKRRRDDVPF